MNSVYFSINIFIHITDNVALSYMLLTLIRFILFICIYFYVVVISVQINKYLLMNFVLIRSSSTATVFAKGGSLYRVRQLSKLNNTHFMKQKIFICLFLHHRHFVSM